MPPKDASRFTELANEAVRRSDEFDWSDERDLDFATRGFIASLEDPVIRDEDGRTVWDLEQYSFLGQETAPATVNPSLWRQARLNMRHGLFKVTDRIYQVRGHDLSVVSFIDGDSGWIVIDPLISAETAKASLELVLSHVEDKPVVAVIYTHSHVDHFGGVRGVVSEPEVRAGNARIIAPEGFMEAAITENIVAGNAMGRRASYMYGSLLPRGPKGQVDAALGKATSSGTITLIEPTDYVSETGTEMEVDGVRLVFQVTPGTEAPAEMNFFFPQFDALCMAENCSHNLHNILTLRGAQVRDARAWAHYLGEAIELFAGQADMVFTSHHWPVWGRDELVGYMKMQMNMYMYLHDQTVRLMNKGYTGIEIAETLTLPDHLARQWYNRGYYGSISHNVKAIYQKYMGWFDGNPAGLHPLPPVEAGKKYVEFMGGAESMLARAREAYDSGEYRWVAQVVNHLVFAEPDNLEARALQADALEQMGYQSENATWRNFYLTGAMELRDSVMKIEGADPAGSIDIVKSLSPDMLFDFLGVMLDADAASGKRITINWDFVDTGETYVLTLEDCVLGNSRRALSDDADLTIRLARDLLTDVLTGKADIMGKIECGEISMEGAAARLGELLCLIERPDFWFNIVTP